MPADHSLGLDDRQGIQDTRRNTVQPDEEKPVSVAKGQPFGSLPAQYIELMAQGNNFRLAVNPQPEESDDRAPDQSENVCHRQQTSPNIGSLASQIEFAVGTAPRAASYTTLGDTTRNHS